MSESPHKTDAALPVGHPGGERFGPYTVCERLGVGGMATVHRAIEHGADGQARNVALKRLLPHLAEDETFVRSFVREAKLASMLQHPNIVQLYELGRVGHVYFISMEYIDGRDLRRLLRQARRVAGPPPLAVTLSVMLQLLEALGYAHTRRDEHGQPLGLVHRDVSPSNLLLTTGGDVKIIDFGIAKAQAQQFRTQTGRVKGKLAYMAPEAISGKSTDSRADVFSAGIIAHELLTARPLFASKNEYQTLLKVQRGDIAAPSTQNPQCPRELDAVIAKALDRDPDTRFGSAAAFRAALVGVQRRLGVEATAHQVKQWCEWAFALPDPSADKPGAVDVAGPTNTWRRPPTATASPMDAHVARAHVEEDEVVEEAWGQREQTSGVPVVLDDVPDVSEKMDATIVDLRPGALAGRDGRRKRTTSSFVWAAGSRDDAVDEAMRATYEAPLSLGAAVVHGGERSRWPKWVALGLMLGALAYGAWWAVRRAPAPTTPPAAETTLAPAPVPPSKVRITVVPANATIVIDGEAPQQGSPFVRELAPGEYNLTISHPGYKPAVLNLNVQPREALAIHHVLEQASANHLASVVLRFDAKYAARLDESDWQTTSPLQRELQPGPHELVLKAQGETVWRKHFVAKADATYVFEPTPSEIRQRLAGDAAASVAEPSPSRPAPAPLAPDAPSEAPAPLAAPPSPVAASPAAAAPPPASSATSLIVAAATAPRSSASREPRVVPPGTVTRLAGATPKLREDRDLPEYISNKLCIDAAGAVSSVSVLGAVPARAKRDIETAIRGWTYRPYLDQGRAVPVCFVVSFAVR